MKFPVILALTFGQLSGAGSWYKVDWRVGDGTWEKTSEGFAKTTGIDRYRLYEQSFPNFWTYRLEVNLVAGASGWGRTYGFDDGTGDEYLITAFRDGEHYTRYNSRRPNIRWVGDSES
ncbi:hypothetical protein F5Y04DRAFT_284377 [Hypomontagnella monticulosa]|nr:hypothetical protein F5Y04DRAFT_284377 [Hypomontagnella monticulosa]